MRIFLSSLILALLTFTGCNQAEPAPVKKSAYAKPDWIYSPCQNGKIGAVGIAEFHTKGPSYQKDLAVKRALVELSNQQGVEVTASSNVKEKYSSDGRASSSMNSDASFNTNTNVSAHIEATWHDKMSDRLYVWMVMN